MKPDLIINVRDLPSLILSLRIDRFVDLGLCMIVLNVDLHKIGTMFDIVFMGNVGASSSGRCYRLLVNNIVGSHDNEAQYIHRISDLTQCNWMLNEDFRPICDNASATLTMYKHLIDAYRMTRNDLHGKRETPV
jgi:hypothetical protein